MLGTTHPPTQHHIPEDLNPNHATVRTSDLTGSGLSGGVLWHRTPGQVEDLTALLCDTLPANLTAHVWTMLITQHLLSTPRNPSQYPYTFTSPLCTVSTIRCLSTPITFLPPSNATRGTHYPLLMCDTMLVVAKSQHLGVPSAMLHASTYHIFCTTRHVNLSCSDGPID